MMTGAPAKQFVGAIILFIVACTNVHSANIQETDDKLCAFKLEGTITPGDHDRLANLISHSRLDPLDERLETLPAVRSARVTASN